jgi:hypothetical protein
MHDYESGKAILTRDQLKEYHDEESVFSETLQRAFEKGDTDDPYGKSWTYEKELKL